MKLKFSEDYWFIYIRDLMECDLENINCLYLFSLAHSINFSEITILNSLRR